MATLGNKMRAYIRPDSGNYAWLTGEQNNSITRSAEAIEVSDKSNDWAQNIAGKKSWSLSVTVFADNADEVQLKAFNALDMGSEVAVFVGILGTGSTPSSGDSGTGIITGISDTNDMGAARTRTIDITGTGALTHYSSEA